MKKYFPDAETILPSTSSKRTEWMRQLLSSTNDNLRSKSTIIESSDSNLDDSDSDLNVTIDQLNRTNLDSNDDVSEHDIDHIEKKRKPMTYKKTFNIKKPEYPLKLKDYTDANGLRYYSDKINKIEVILMNNFIFVKITKFWLYFSTHL